MIKQIEVKTSTPNLTEILKASIWEQLFTALSQVILLGDLLQNLRA